jgi:hypothetical protein
MAQHNVKLLVDQSTGFVVWMSYNLQMPPPIIDPTVNYYIFNGNTELPIYKLYNDYALFFFHGAKEFAEAQSVNTDQRLFTLSQLIRAKTTAFAYAQILTKTKYERLGMTNPTLINSLKESMYEQSPWASFYQDEHKCSSAEALKIMQFQVEEYNSVVFRLESSLLSFKNKIQSSTTLNEVVDALTIYCNKMIEPVLPLKDLPQIKGPQWLTNW